jgi:hypothetical protein
VLVQFALLTFGFLALAALVIDLGLVRLARLQMQTATSGAALEGLRFRDELPPGFPPGSDVDASRREAAGRLASWVFDDDLNSSNGDSTTYGAGPLLEFRDGIALAGTSYRASQLITLPDPPVYKPDLRTNYPDNDKAGDMLSGTWRGGEDHSEGSDYSRRDFLSPGNDAFLVRMRRTSESFDAGSTTSSSGPPVPMIFGRGSLLNFDSRAAGIPVRATVIATARRVQSVGYPDPARSLPGATPFVLRRTAWAELGTDILTGATVTTGSPDVAIRGNVVGWFIDLDAIAVTVLGQEAIAVPATSSLLARLPTDGISYAPIVADNGPLAGRVIGFGFLDVTRDATNQNELVLTKRTNRIAALNASATPAEPLADVFSDQPDDPDLTDLFEAHAGGGPNALADPLLGAALVR